MPKKLEIRRAVRNDLGAIAKLAAQLVHLHHDTDPDRFFLIEDVEKGYEWWLGRELERKEAIVMIAVEDESIVGYAYATIEERDWNMLLDEHGAIHDIFVDQRARKRGVGKELLEGMIAELESRKVPRIVLSTMVSNKPAQALFQRAGFRPTMLEMTRNTSSRA